MAVRDRRPFHFSTLEMLAVAAGYLVTSSFVFLLGFYVGKGNSALHEGPGEHVARIRVEDPSRYVPTAPQPAPAQEASAAVEPPSEPAPAAASGPKPEPVAEAKPEPAKPAEEPAPADRVPDAPRKPAVSEGGYSVQVLATRRRADADAMARSLMGSGMDAYVREAVDGEDRWYRVRIGRFGDAAAARSVAERCRDALGLDQAFVCFF